MIDYIGRFVSSVSEALEFNQATLSGCIDVIVIEQEDGTHMCTPFHVRFGKLKVLKSKEKVVTINVNGKDAEFKMKLGAAGDGFFEEKRDLRLSEEIMSDSQSDPENYMSSEDDSEITSPRREDENGNEVKRDPKKLTSNGKQAKKWGWLWKSTPDDVIQPEKEKEDEMKHAIEKLLEDQLGSAKESEKAEVLHDIEEGPSRGALVEEKEAVSEKRPFEEEKDRQTISEIVAEHNQNIRNDNIEKNGEHHHHHEVLAHTHAHDHDHDHKHIPEHMSRFSPQTQDQAHGMIHPQSETTISNLAPITEQDQEHEQGQGQVKTQTPVKEKGEKSEKGDELDPEKKKKKKGIIRSFLSMFKSEGEIKLPNNERKTVSSTTTMQMSTDLKKGEKDSKNDKRADSETLSFPEAIENVDFDISEEKREPSKEKPSDATEFPPDADIELSLCGNYIDDKEHEDLTTIFLKHRVPFSKFLKDPFQVLSNQNLMVKIDDKLYDWKTACPLIIALLAYKRPLPEEVLQDLAARESTKSSSSWKDWFSSSKKEEKPKKEEKGTKSDKKDQKDSKESKDSKDKKEKDQKGKSETKEPKETKKPEEKVYAEEAKHEEIQRPDGVLDPPTVRDEKPPMITEKQIIRENLAQEKMLAKSGEIDAETSTKKGKVRRTLRPNSEMLKTLNLKPGCNTISYTVHGGIQGEQTLTANIYLWPANVKIVISDIDGTITKSDVLGQLMPMMGRDWSQPGVTSLYSNIRKNGYQILYLTARAIGQSQLTKNFLNSLTQDGYSLPPGPVILSPDRLVPSFKREIIYRKPEVFKIACLRDLRSLFAPNHNPFYAGFGNRETDAIAYQAVGVPSGKIFTINTVGEIRLLNATYSKSYVLINDMVHDMFPGIEMDDKYLASEEYNLVNYFKVNYETLIDFDVSELLG